MEIKTIDGYKIVDGGVCAPLGFTASGIHCGLGKDPNKKDLGLIFAEKKCTAVAVYTQNKVKGAPIIVTKKNLRNASARAVIVNSKNANTCNADGEEKAKEMCFLAANALNIKENDVIVASTGVIGQVLDINPIKSKIDELAKNLSESGSNDCANAIMTTDTFSKEIALEFYIGDKLVRIGGIAKGSGMIHPNMATTLNFITTDVAISSKMLKKALVEVTNVTYNRLSVDGDTSTNDMVSLMASGLSKSVEISMPDENFQKFKTGLYVVMMNLTKMLARDGEGATKIIECRCVNAKSEIVAEKIAKSVITSSLFKAAMFGADANWGRILCAIGYTDARFDIEKVDVYISSSSGKIKVCENGAGVLFSEEYAKKILLQEEIFIEIDLNSGTEEATAWGCDLTYDYVKINGDYRS